MLVKILKVLPLRVSNFTDRNGQPAVFKTKPLVCQNESGTIYAEAIQDTAQKIEDAQVQEGMYVASIPFFPTDKRTYSMEELKADQRVMMELYPEIYACIGCNACTKACTQSLNVMQYIAYAQRGELEKCAEESFDCVSCGCCSVRCPAGISHPMVGLLARRLTGKYIAPKTEHLYNRVEEVNTGAYDELIEAIMQKPITEMQELYNNRDIEK